jgi:two-component system nitrate/nitrite response regulator NarL
VGLTIPLNASSWGPHPPRFLTTPKKVSAVSNSAWPRRDNTRVLIVDSSRVTSQLFAAVLKRDRFQVVYAGASADDALAELSRSQVDVALISAILEGQPGKGLELATQIRIRYPHVQVVIIIEKSEGGSVVEAFRAGARGIFGRDSSLSALSKCVSSVHKGQVWASNEELRHLLEALVAPPHTRVVNANGSELLAPREQEVVHWVAEGLTNREIADRMGLSENTVKNYMFRIFDKLGVSKRVELVLYAASQFPTWPPTGATKIPATELGGDAALFRWCREAVERFQFIPYMLGEMHRTGRGVPADKFNALIWFMIAQLLAPQLVAQAQSASEELQRKLSPEQVAAARAKALEWLAKRAAPASIVENNQLERALGDD